MRNKLESALKTQILSAIYTDVEHTSQFTVGYVLAIDDSYVVLKLVNPYGYYDGIACIMIDDVYRVENETKYLNTLEKLAKYHNTLNDNIEKLQSFNDVLSTIKKRHRICEIELCDNARIDIIGYIENETQEELEVLGVTVDGENDGNISVQKDMISVISFDSCDTNKSEILRKL